MNKWTNSSYDVGTRTYLCGLMKQPALLDPLGLSLSQAIQLFVAQLRMFPHSQTDLDFFLLQWKQMLLFVPVPAAVVVVVVVVAAAAAMMYRQMRLVH